MRIPQFEDAALWTLGSVTSAWSWGQALHSGRRAALGGAGWPAPARPPRSACSACLGRVLTDTTLNSA